MAKQHLYEYIVLYHPREKKDSDGNVIKQDSKLLVGISQLLASSDREVGMIAARKIPDEYLDELEQVEVVVRSF